MEILVCIKRVPATGGRVILSDDGRSIDARHLSFTISPHEECAVEAAVQLVEAHGGASTVLTLGPASAAEQLRESMAVGIDRAIHLVADGEDWDPQATARAIVAAVRDEVAAGARPDLILFGNEAADSGDYQVAVRVASALGYPWLTGVKAFEVDGERLRARREAAGGWDVFELPLPAVLSIREGLNRPRYPSIPGRLRAKKKELVASSPAPQPGGLQLQRLRLPEEGEHQVEVLGTGPEAAPAVVQLLRSMGLVS
jgi:electron transfer flavoprotein beta subunit